MKILWQYLKPHQRIVFLSLLLAAIAQLLSLIDPIIFGKIIDDYASNPKNLPQNELDKRGAFLAGYCYWHCNAGRLGKSIPGIYYPACGGPLWDADI